MIKGIDVSHFQEVIAWDKVPADVEFAMIKCTDGSKGVDPMYSINLANARATGKGIGHTHYAEGADPIVEADHFMANATVMPGEVLNLDFEVNIADPNDWCNKFVQEIYNKKGFWPLFYSYQSMLALMTQGAVLNCGLWVADPSNLTPIIGKWAFFATLQYTTVGANVIPGIATSVDCDYFNGTLDQFKKYGMPDLAGREVECPYCHKIFTISK